MRLIDADKADVERIPCFYSTECDLMDVQVWLDEQPTVNQYEWVSVEDRLPEKEATIKWREYTGYKSVRVLCACKQKSGKVFVKEGYYEMWGQGEEPCWRIPGSIDSVTHWMPLPEPPKD